jgi:hypothetical protein
MLMTSMPASAAARTEAAPATSAASLRRTRACRACASHARASPLGLVCTSAWEFELCSNAVGRRTWRHCRRIRPHGSKPVRNPREPPRHQARTCAWWRSVLATCSTTTICICCSSRARPSTAASRRVGSWPRAAPISPARTVTRERTRRSQSSAIPRIGYAGLVRELDLDPPPVDRRYTAGHCRRSTGFRGSTHDRQQPPSRRGFSPASPSIGRPRVFLLPIYF